MVPSGVASQGGEVPSSSFSPAAQNALAREMGLRLQRLRAERGLSQERTAHLAGISAYTYQKFEKGESKPGTPMNPRLLTLLALAEVFEVKLRDIVGPDL